MREGGVDGRIFGCDSGICPPPSWLSCGRPLGAPESCGAEGSPRVQISCSLPAAQPSSGPGQAAPRWEPQFGHLSCRVTMQHQRDWKLLPAQVLRSRCQAGLLSVRAGTRGGAGPASRNPAAAGPARPSGSPRASGPSGRPAPLTNRPSWQLSHCPGAPRGERAAAGTQGRVPGQVARALVSTPGWRSECRSGATPLHKSPSLCQRTWALLLPELSKELRGHKEGG